MALTCARCGAQNLDGNQFCQACGTPLSAASVGAPPPPPPSPSAPPSGLPVAYASPPPTAYTSPYYAPAGAAPQAAVHRTPWVLIIGGVVALVLVMAGCGTALALLGGGGGVTVNGGVSGLPSPTPATTPSPIASPTSSTKNATSASNDGVTVPLRPGWTVASQDAESITLVNPNSTGSLTIASGTSNPRMSAQQNKDDLDKALKSKYPDTAPCAGSKTTTGNVNGAQGVFWNLCFTLTSTGRSFPAVASLFVGANASGSVYYLVMMVTNQSMLQAFSAECQPVIQGVQWKLK
ncbi:MAG: hypothetical protein NVS9B11_12980 [Candidatus Dormibacteraceae bacterium]